LELNVFHATSLPKTFYINEKALIITAKMLLQSPKSLPGDSAIWVFSGQLGQLGQLGQFGTGTVGDGTIPHLHSIMYAAAIARLLA